MGDVFYLDYQGVDSAKSRFRAHSTDLANAGREGAEASMTQCAGTGDPCRPVQSAADNVLAALGGRLQVFSAEFSALAGLVGDTVTVANEIDVTYVL